jgi:cysteinyl-tRNA synthetase
MLLGTSLRLTNTLTRSKGPFVPLRAPAADSLPEVGLYVCGVTVYDYCHVGHARAYVVFDVVQRTLRKLGYPLRYVRNFTDVDDKIIARANHNGESCDSLTERFIAAFYQDMDLLDCQRPDVEPRVTTHMPEILSMIATIIARGHGYAVPGEFGGQDVYFDVATDTDYGCLSGRAQDDNQDGASDRVQHDPRKRNQADFALWKSAKPGEPSWESPWGAGRPGWHIECSAMSCKHLGPTFDIHGGGRDLVFPHHENEIAQSRAANGQDYAKYWIHNGFVTIDSEKMSKSTGNFFRIRDVLERYHPQTLRYFLLTAHYLQPMNFSDKALDDANRRVLYVYEKLALADAILAQKQVKPTGAEPEVVTRSRAELLEALSDDFNTPRALATLSEPLTVLAAALDKPKDAEQLRVAAHVRGLLTEASAVLGLFHHPAADTATAIVELTRARLFPDGSDKLARVCDLVAQRQAAREAKDWTRADELRQALLADGVEVRDTREGSTWRPLLDGG